MVVVDFAVVEPLGDELAHLRGGVASADVLAVAAAAGGAVGKKGDVSLEMVLGKGELRAREFGLRD